MHVLVPDASLGTAMDFVPNENAGEILQHCISGLVRSDLLEIPFYVSPEHINASGKQQFGNEWIDVTDRGVVVGPTRHGIELFLWGAGSDSVELSRYLNAEAKFVAPNGVHIPNTTVRCVKNAT
jgi:hypothetical protein